MLDFLGPLFVRAYFTWQWYTGWLIGFAALAAVVAFYKNRPPLLWFALSYLLTPICTMVLLLVAPAREMPVRSRASAPLLAVLLLVIGGGVAWSAMTKFPGMWRSMSGLTAAAPFEPQTITVKRSVIVRTPEKDISLSPGTRVYASGQRGAWYIVRIGRAEALLPVDAAGR